MLEAGDAAPGFEARDGDGQMWRLDDLRGKKIILFFYPADDTPGCTIEACDFRDSLEEFKKAGYVVLGVSPQGAESHRAFSKKFNLNFPLLIDEDMDLAKAYDVEGPRGDWNGIPLVVKRSTFVIDEDGKIEQVLYGIKARGHVGSLRELIGVAV